MTKHDKALDLVRDLRTDTDRHTTDCESVQCWRYVEQLLEKVGQYRDDRKKPPETFSLSIYNHSKTELLRFIEESDE